MKAIGALIIGFAILRDLPYEVKDRAIRQLAARAPQCWTTVKQVQDYLKQQMGRR